MKRALPILLLLAGATFLPAADETPLTAPALSVGSATIGHQGGVVVSADGAISVEFAPNPLREPTPTRVWSMVAPGGRGFAVDGGLGPAKLTCWTPDSPWSPGTTGVGDPVSTAPSGGQSNDGGVEILGPDQAWTTVKSELRPDGSRVIEFVDERKKLREQGLVKGSTGSYVLVPQKTTVLRRQDARFKVIEVKKQQDEWKKLIEELSPIAPRQPPKPAPAPTPDPDELAPITPTRPSKSTGDPAIDDLAPITPVRPARK